MPDSGCELLLSRRSIRRYKPDPVELELILKALDVARFAPSAHNRQPWEFVVVRDRATLEKLSRVHRWSGPVAGAQAAIVVLADRRQAPDSFLQDGSIAATYLWLALHCVGLGTVWIYTLQEAEAIREVIGAPEHLFPVAIFPVGFPAEQPKARPRKELRELVHLDSYGKKLE
ncbi:MAG: nitroreductase family protein [Thermofilum sp.]|uniref:Nitroreductase family protein n=1 Tax=Thermofilum pendens TaxID=2269 RepID=A0A7C4D4X9_THEPE